jgi:hypothetical protein
MTTSVINKEHSFTHGLCVVPGTKPQTPSPASDERHWIWSLANLVTDTKNTGMITEE